jgi:hypothetical protein
MPDLERVPEPHDVLWGEWPPDARPARQAKAIAVVSVDYAHASS